MITLYDYFRSSASYRVRIALNVKGLEYDLREVHLVNNGGEQHSASYKELNPQELVPTLVEDDNRITQSMAILEYLESQYPEPALIWGDIATQAKMRSLANIISCDIHPLDNLRVLQYLKNTLAVSDEQKNTWYAHWITLGFNAFEALLPDANYCIDNKLSIADVCLVPQVYNACRFKCDMHKYPKIIKAYQNAMQHEEIQKASPPDWAELAKGIL